MAGKGSRFKEEGYKDSKPFIDVNGKPMIERVIENLNIEFDNLNYQDLTITEAVICDQGGLEKIVKLSFIKGPIQDI